MMSNETNSTFSPPAWQDSEEINLRDYLQVVWRRRWAIVLAFVLIVCTTLVVSLQMRPVYQASAVLEIQKPSSGMSLEELFSDNMGMGAEKNVSTEVEILKSRTVVADAVRLGGLQLVLDRSKPLYKRLFEQYASRFKRLLAMTEHQGKEEPAVLDKASEPLSLELLGASPLKKPLRFKVLFSGNSTFRLLDADGKPLALCRMGKPCSTPFFSFRFHGTAPPEGTTFPLILRPLASAVMDLQSRLKVTPIRNTRLIRLKLTASYPDDAQRQLSNVVHAYQQLKIKQKTHMASKALEFIEHQLETVDAEMQQAVDKLKRFKEENQLVNLSETVTAAIDQLAELEKSHNELIILRQQAKFLLTAIQGQHPVDSKSLYALGNAMGQPQLVFLAEALTKQQAERAALRSQYTEQHPRIQALDRKISELKGKLKAEVKSLIASLDAQQAALARQISKAEKGLKKLPESEQHLADLMRQARVYQDTYSFLLKKKGELQVTRAGQIGDVWVIERPYAEPNHIKPRLFMNVMIAAMVGLMLGIGLAFFLEFLDDSVKNPEDVKSVAQLPVLGSIGHYAPSHDGLPPYQRYLPVLDDQRSQLAEAFRTLRSNLLFTGVDQPLHLMLFTSALPSEGKSTCVANVAVSLAHLGKRVLLVDCDLRRPNIHRIFGLRRSPGLVNILVVQDNWQKELSKAIQGTQVQGLDILPCGDVPPNPNEMLGSEKMASLIDYLAQRYDFILFDSPPLLSVSDAMVLTPRVDGVVLVVRANQTSRSAVKTVVDLLSKAHTQILGVIVNDIDFKRERYYYHYYHDGYYAYGEQAPEPSKKRHHGRRKLSKR